MSGYATETSSLHFNTLDPGNRGPVSEIQDPELGTSSIIQTKEFDNGQKKNINLDTQPTKHLSREELKEKAKVNPFLHFFAGGYDDFMFFVLLEAILI